MIEIDHDEAPKEFVCIYKAPQQGMSQEQLDFGYDPEDFPDEFSDGGRAYFAKDRALAEQFALVYGEGVIEVQVLTEVYNARLRRYEGQYQQGPFIELAIPHVDFEVLNASRRIHHGS